MSSIRVDHRDRRSALSAVVQAILKPIGSTLIKLDGEKPAGSPRLTPHRSAAKKCHIREHSIEDTWIYTFSSHTSTSSTTSESEKRKVVGCIYYFHGGGFRNPPEKEHWLVCAKLCSKLPEYKISLVSYPLAPNNPAHKAIPHLIRFLRALEVQAIDNARPITLVGDSSGANLAIVLGINAATEYLKNEQKTTQHCPVRSVLVISPPADMRNNNPDIDKIDGHDPLLSRKTITEVAENWRGEWGVSDPRISPVLADLSVFARAHVKVDGVIGEYDTLTPDAQLFRKELETNGVVGDWLEWDKQVHAFPLMFSYYVPEAREGMRWIQDVLRRNASSTVSEVAPKDEA